MRLYRYRERDGAVAEEMPGDLGDLAASEQTESKMRFPLYGVQRAFMRQGISLESGQPAGGVRADGVDMSMRGCRL